MVLLVCRALPFLKKSFDSTVPPMELAPEDEELVAIVTKELRAFNEGLDKIKYVQILSRCLCISQNASLLRGPHSYSRC